MITSKQYHVLCCCLVVLFVSWTWQTTFGLDQSHHHFGVTAYTYYSVDDTNNPDSSISKPHFSSHLSDIRNNGYKALSAEEVFEQLQNHHTSRAGQILLTFEGGYQNFYDQAWPILKDNNYPVTIFIPVDNVGAPDYMDWDTLKDLSKNNNVTLGINGCSYISLINLSENELRDCINRSIGNFQDNMGYRPRYFSVPYGIYDETTLNVLNEYDFDLIFGQHSGIIDLKTEETVLPRFPMTSQFAEPERFRMLAEGGSLNVSNIIPTTPIIENENYPFHIGMTVNTPGIQLDGIQCFLSDHGVVPTETISNQRLRIIIKEPLSAGRHRINCTYYDELYGTYDSWKETPHMRWWGYIIYIRESITNVKRSRSPS